MAFVFFFMAEADFVVVVLFCLRKGSNREEEEEGDLKLEHCCSYKILLTR